MDKQEGNQLAQQAREHLFGHILPFWTGPALDHEQGGWLAWMSNDLRVDRAQPKGLIVNSRILWTFSAAHRAQPEPLYRQMADRAYDIVMNRFWDPDHGGAFWRLDGQGHVLDEAKKIYGQAFYIYALTEYYREFGVKPALERAIRVFELIELHAYDAQAGGYFEVCRRDWSVAADSRLSEKDMNEKKSMNNHLHLLEAYTNLYRTWRHAELHQRLIELLALFQEKILQDTHHLSHFFNEHWGVRSESYTYGHDIEASWLLCEAVEACADPTLLSQVRSVALRMAEAVFAEGLDADGGLCYEGKAGTVIDRGKECWPQAEAAVGFVNAFQISGDRKYFQAAAGVWNYIQQHLVDRLHGEWFWRINPDGCPDPNLPKVSEWKGPYHGSRACLEMMRRLPCKDSNKVHD